MTHTDYTIMKGLIPSAKRIVIKIGTRVITDEFGKLNMERMSSIAADTAFLHSQGKEVLLVSSGAIGAGIGELSLSRKPTKLHTMQAIASIGQCRLIMAYYDLFKQHGITISQVLLTREDIQDRTRFLNAKNTMNETISMGAVPIINENDTLSVEEIRFGDNDTLSALVSSMAQANLLIILTDVDGLMNMDPTHKQGGNVIPHVSSIDQSITTLGGAPKEALGTGGMKTKIDAARIVTECGEAMLIANGTKPGILRAIFSGKETGTLFLPKKQKLSSKKRWLAYYSRPKGTVVLDDGATKALKQKGRSLLPKGITSVIGTFSQGAVINMSDKKGVVIARGLSNYSSDEIDAIKGNNSSAIEQLLGYNSYDEVVHRNNLSLLYPE